MQNAPKKGKWAHVAEELSTKDILPHEADEILEEGRKWRKGFSIPREKAILVTNDGMAAVVPEICSQFRYEDWTK